MKKPTLFNTTNYHTGIYKQNEYNNLNCYISSVVVKIDTNDHPIQILCTMMDFMDMDDQEIHEKTIEISLN